MRSLEKAVIDGPPSPDQLPDRLILEDYATDFIRRSRERDFAWVAKLPALLHLLKAFTAQNEGSERVTSRDSSSETICCSAPTIMTSGIWPTRAEAPPPEALPSRVELLLRDLVDRLGTRVPSATGSAHVSLTNASILSRQDAPAAETVPISVAITRFMTAEVARTGNGKSEARFRPILQFMQDFYANIALSDLTSDDLHALDAALPNIPGLKGCPLALRRSLHGRYRLAQGRGWDDLERVTLTTLDLRYRTPLRIFFKWAVGAKLFPGPVPSFTAKSDEILAPLPRDRLQDEEIIRFVSAPLFTGCDGPRRIWVPGKIFIQGDLYWAFLILLLTGMRTGEPPQIRLDDIVRIDEVTDGGETLTVYFFDMRPYDPAKGRRPLKALKNLKRADSARVIPIHPLLIDLGLLDRIDYLRSIGAEGLFPDIRPHISGSGEVRWGKSISKAFAHARKRPNINLSRANICLYSTRQLMVDWLDSLRTPQRVRNRVMGHTNDANAADDYGGKGLMPLAQASCITTLETPVIREMRKVLIGALAKVAEGKLMRMEPAERRRF